MTIYANRISNNNGELIQIKLQVPLQDSDILMYNYDKKAFTNVNTIKVGQITSAQNYGGTNSVGLYANQDNTTLMFKEIIPGNGIEINQTDTSITINTNLNTSSMSVPGSYKITVGTQTPNSKFEVWTASSTPINQKTITEPMSIDFLLQDVYTGNDPNYNKGFFQTVNAGNGFYDNGLRPNMYIEVDNAGDQSGLYQIYDIVLSNVSGAMYTTLYINQLFDGTTAYNLGGPKPSVHFVSYDLYAEIDSLIEQYTNLGLTPPPPPFDMKYLISSWFYDFGPDGYNIVEGMQFRLVGSDVHDGVYLIKSVIPKGQNQLSMLEIDETTPLPIPGLIKGSNVQLVFDAQNVPTGFSVDTSGTVLANTVAAQNMEVIQAPVNSNDVVNKQYVDNFTAKISQSKMYFMSFLN